MAKTRYVRLALTAAHARGLLVLANEGAADLLSDPDAARGHVGNATAIRQANEALRRLRRAVGEISP